VGTFNTCAYPGGRTILGAGLQPLACLELRVRIPSGVWMSVLSAVCGQVEVTGSAAAELLGLRVRIPSGVWMSVLSAVCVVR